MLTNPPSSESTLNETKIRAVRDSETQGLIDIQVAMTESKRQDFLRRASDRHASSAQSCITYIIQKHLADFYVKTERRVQKRKNKPGYQPVENSYLESIEERQKILNNHIHAMSMCFIPLEEILNNPYLDNSQLDPAEAVKNLEKRLENFYVAINNIISQLKDEYPNKSPILYKAEIAIALTKLRNKINGHVKDFKHYIEQLEKNIPTRREVKDLFRLHHAEGKASLGKFMEKCSLDVLEAGIDLAHAIKEQTFERRTKSHIWESTSVKTLSRAKREIREKFSIVGIIENTQYPVPDAQLKHLTTGKAASDDKQPEKWQSLAPYVENWDRLDVEPMLNAALGINSEKSEMPSMAYSAGIFAATIGEALLAVPAAGIAAAINLTALPFYLIETGIRAISSSTSATPSIILNTASYCHKKMTDAYEYISDSFGILATKKLFEKQYRHPNADINNFIHEELPPPTNWYYDILRATNPDGVLPYVANQISGIGQAFWRVGSELWSNPISPYNYLKKQVFSQNTDKHEKYRQMEAKIKFQMILDEIINQHAKTDTSTNTEIGEYPKLEYSQKTNIANPLDVPNEILKILAKMVRDAFCESPGIATLFFDVAVLTLFSSVLPAAAASIEVIKVLSSALLQPANYLSIYTMNADFSASLVSKLPTLFTLWQLSWAAVDGSKAMLTGKYELFHRIFSNPEKLLLGVIICTAFGEVLGNFGHHLLIPDFSVKGYPMYNLQLFQASWNALIEEAIVLQATPTETLLGVKFLMLLHSMGHGYHPRHAINGFCIAVFATHKLYKITDKKQRQEQLENILNESEYSSLTTEQKNEVIEKLNATLESVNLIEDDNKEAESEKKSEDQIPLLENLEKIVLTTRPAEVTPLETARTRLEELLKCMKNHPDLFNNNDYNTIKNEFNYVHMVISDYNQELRKAAKDNHQIDIDAFMHEFYNLNYKGSPNIIRLCYFMFGLHPIVKMYQRYKSPVSWYTWLFGIEVSPYNIQQVKHSEAKNQANLLDFYGALLSSFAELTRATQNMTRSVIGGVLYLPLSIMAAVTYPFGYSDSVNNYARELDNWLRNNIHWTNVELPSWLDWSRYTAKIVTKASSACDLVTTAEQALAQLSAEAAAKINGNNEVTGNDTETASQGYLNYFFAKKALTDINELARQPQTRKQQELLAKLAILRDGENQDNSKAEKLIEKLPQHWREIVKKNYFKQESAQNSSTTTV